MFDLIRGLVALLKVAETLSNGNTYLPITSDGNWGLIFPAGDGLSLDTIRIGRKDGQFYDLRFVDMGGYKCPIVYEEPRITPGEDGLRLVGKISVVFRDDGHVLVRSTTDTGRANDLELVGTSSTSKAEVVPGAKQARLKTNIKRIGGDVEVLTERVDATLEPPKNARWMQLSEFLNQSHDARGLAAIAKAIESDRNLRRALMVSYLSR